MANKDSATWIWYPGDFEIWLGNRFNNRRTERGAMFPPFWKQDRHAWDETGSMFWSDPYTGQSAHSWGRATGWYAMALAEVLDVFPKDHPERQSLAGDL